ncbi:MAG: tetratricopeptide repeat protein [Acidobacteriota bacterium]
MEPSEPRSERERHELLSKLLNEALERTPAERARFFEEQVEVDLRSDLTSLLAHADATGFEPVRGGLDELAASLLGNDDEVPTAEQRRRALELVHELRALPTEERARLLAQVRSSDLRLASIIDELFSATSDEPLALGEPRPERIGRYHVETELGRGGMGIVWRARDELLGRSVALKVLAGPVAGAAESLLRFEREARLLARLSHPHLATVHDLVELEGRPVLVMELLDGVSLARRLGDGPLGLDETLRLGREVASALELAHGHGIVHRDLKPANVQLTESGACKVLDFGLARPLQGEGGSVEFTTGARVFAGTPGYMSPEQVRLQPLDGRSDLFALGVVLRECLCGTPTFPGETAADRMLAVLHHEPDWSALPSNAPPSLRDLLERCLLRDKERRFGDARELRRALEEVGQSSVGGAAAVRHESAPTATSRHSLPSERDEFIGREAELVQLSEHRSAGRRLVTVLGTAGVGKTRLAIHHAWSELESGSGPVWFCDLSDARTLDDVVAAMASLLEIPPAPDLAERVGHALARHESCTVILDNFEQLVPLAEECLGRWLDRASGARFLVTSRQLLRLPGEQVLELAPLPIDGAALELFMERARAHRPGFTPDLEERRTLAELLRLLDGLPLAIELAVARLRLLSPAQLLRGMEARFRVLGSRPPGAGRRSTLQASIDWSWEHLEPWEKAALGQCSVFVGSFTLEAAEAVIDLSAWPEAGFTLDVVQSLVDKSLLRTWTSERVWKEHEVQGPFLSLYLSVRDHVRETLRSDEALPGGPKGLALEAAAARRHGLYFARLGGEEPIRDAAWLDRQRRRQQALPNLMVACERAVEDGQATTAFRAFLAAWHVQLRQGSADFVISQAERMESLPGLTDAERCRLLVVSATAVRRGGRPELALERLKTARALAMKVGDEPALADVARVMGILLMERGATAEAGEELATALRLAPSDDAQVRKETLLVLGNLALRQGRPSEAREHYDAAMSFARSGGDRVLEAVVLSNLAAMESLGGRFEEAFELTMKASVIHGETGGLRAEASALINLGTYRLNQGRLDDASRHLQQAVSLTREIGDRIREIGGLLGLAQVDLQAGRLPSARDKLEQALPMARELGHRRHEAHLLEQLGQLHGWEGRHEDAVEHHDAALEICPSVGDKVMEAAARLGRGQALLGLGRAEEASEDLESAVVLAREVGQAPIEGLALMHLGRLSLETSDEASRRYDEAEDALRGHGAPPFALTQLLLSRAELDLVLSDRDRAEARLSEAERLFCRAHPQSPLSAHLAELRRALDSDTGRA